MKRISRNKANKRNKFFSKTSTAKTLFKQILLIAVLGLVLLNINIVSNLVAQTQLQNILLPTQANGSPVRLIIPKINVNAVIQRVGVTSQNSMDVPSNSTDVAWFKLGPKPGEKGSSVIDGHVDSQTGEKGVFSELHQLAKGDKFYVTNDQGKSLSFTVVGTRTYDEGMSAPEVFGKTDGIHLNLITCDGVWDGVNNTYTQRLVVFANASN